MHRAASFASVLDGKLDLACGPAIAPRIATSSWFGDCLAIAGRGRSVWARAAGGWCHVRQDMASPARGVRLHGLPPALQAAVETLRAAGAVLPDCCTSADLRRAFRQLARVYHPDRHPKGSPREHARLAATFSDVRAAYALIRRELAVRGV